MKRVILLLVDGLRPDVAEAALERGELPELRAMTEPAGIGRGITAFPSTTSVAYLPFLTGCTPGQCNVPSIRWMDRSTYQGRWWRDRGEIRSYCGYQSMHLDSDITPAVRTIFELVPESVGIFTPISKGLTSARDPSRTERRFWGSLAHFAEWHQPSDEAVSRHLLHEVQAGWRFIFAQFPAVDGYTHQSTPDGAKALRALCRVDETVGRLRQLLTSRGELEDTLILLVSDHGASVVHTHLDLADWFRAQGVRTLSHPVLWERNPRAAVMVAGNGSVMVYARPGKPRAARWPMERLRAPETFETSHDVIANLVKEPAVAFVASEETPGTVRVWSSEGEALVIREAGRVRYQPGSGDPLLLGPGRVLSPSEWLAASWDGEYPDACVQLLDQFRSPRTGDLIVVAREGYDFRRRFEVPEHKSGHGSLIRAHMQIPVWASVAAPTSTVRSVDLFPSMLEWLGEECPQDIDGESIWSPSRAATVASGP
jgi:Type I phosphodiesterase / nucleotide pyrophosphatase